MHITESLRLLLYLIVRFPFLRLTVSLYISFCFISSFSLLSNFVHILIVLLLGKALRLLAH